MALHTGRLILAPQDPMAAPARELLRDRLLQARLFGPPLAAHRPDAFAPGERFFDYIGFTGCAVNIGSGGEDHACHLVLESPGEQPQFFSGRNTRPPRCPECRKTLTDWRGQASAWLAFGQSRLRCNACASDTPAWRWNWRGQAGFARLALKIEEVFPGEASPLPTLMTLLEQESNLPWHWFAVQD